MKYEDMGYNARTGMHNKNLTAMESRFIGILWVDHEGEENAMPARELAEAFLPEVSMGMALRDVRYMHNHILMEHRHIPLLSKAGKDGGYYIAVDEEEANRFYDSFRKRGLTGVVKASRGKQSAVVEMVEQLSFQFEELVDKTSGFKFKSRVAAPTPVEVVDAFLERMLLNPEKFSDGLRKIGAKYGSILLPREQVQAMKMKAAELQALVAGLA
jgi:hypothetical protein